MQHLRIRTSFDQFVPIHVEETKHVSMQDVSLTTTFESIRHAMIVALADPMERVHELKYKSQAEGSGRNSAVDVERSEDSRVLTQKARNIAESIDTLVANASPHLVKAKFEYTLQLVNAY